MILLGALLLVAGVSFAQGEDSGFFDDPVELEAEAPRTARFEPAPQPARDAIDEAEWEEITADHEYERALPPELDEADGGGGWDFGEGFLSSIRVVAWVLVALLILGLLFYFVRQRRANTRVGDVGRGYGLTDELLAASEADLETALDRNLREGDYRGAIRYRFGQLLQNLRAVGLLRWVPGKTNADYGAELPAGDLRFGFGSLSEAFAFATYAGREVTEAQYEAFAGDADALRERLPSAKAGSARFRASRPGAVVGLLTVSALASCDEWAETYDPDDDLPYGTSLLPAILAATFPEADVIPLERSWANAGLLGDWDTSAVYVAIGDGLSYADTEAESLLGFVAAGGEALLATKEVSNAVLAPFAEATCFTTGELTPYYSLDSAQVARSARGYDVAVPSITPVIGFAAYARLINRSDSCLGEARDLLAFTSDGADSEVNPVLARLRYGAGGLTLLTFPLALTNVYATDSVGRALIEEILTFLPETAEVVYFDEARRSPEWVVVDENRPDDEFDLGNPTSADDNILKHVLSRPPLAAAWYALLFGAVAFLAVGAKRRQRVVPLVHPRRNTTREHLGNVSRLYLANPDNARMASKQLRLFEAWTQGRFGLRPLRDATDMARFRSLQGVDGDLVDALERYHTTVARSQGLTNGGLVRLVRILQALRRGAR